MTGRPEILFPLFAGIDTLPGVGPKTARLLANLHVATPKDLLLTLPEKGIDRAPVASIRDVDLPGMATVPVTVVRHMPARARGKPHRVEVEDAKTSWHLVYFRGRGLEDQLPVGERRVVSGRAELYDGVAQMPHPDHVLREGEPLPAYEPVYPLTQGLANRVMLKAVEGALKRVPDLPEWIDPGLLRERGWPAFADALRAAHVPGGPADLAATAPARQRLAYDELLAHQVTLALARGRERARPGIATEGDGRLRRRTADALAFTPTGAQQRAIEEIAAELGRT